MTHAARLLRAGLAAALLVVAACGQRGPLFLPEPAEAPPPAGADTGADPDGDRDDDER